MTQTFKKKQKPSRHRSRHITHQNSPTRSARSDAYTLLPAEHKAHLAPKHIILFTSAMM